MNHETHRAMSVFNYNLSYVHKNLDVFEIAYFFFYTNRPSVHTKPVNPLTETNHCGGRFQKEVAPSTPIRLNISTFPDYCQVLRPVD